ncbi:MAG: hypothetical protein PUB00_05225 [Clostridiales bacterium]|nr:hypothetical protein [Clostridiales bacterium]
MKKVLEYIQQHPHTEINAMADALNENAKDLMEIVNSLVLNGYLKMDHPVPLDMDNNCSCYYSTTGKEYAHN